MGSSSFPGPNRRLEREGTKRFPCPDSPAAGVPHEELNPDPNEAVDFVVLRSDNSGIGVDLDIEPVGHPETVY